MYESLRDWQNHITGAFTFVDDGDIINPFIVHECRGLVDRSRLGPGDVQLHGELIGEGGHSSEATLTGDGVRMDMPDLGVVNVSDHVLYGCYNNTRQWRKSLVRRVVELGSPVLSELRDKGMARLDLSPEAVYNYVNRVYTPFQDALSDVMNGRVLARTIGQHFSGS